MFAGFKETCSTTMLPQDTRIPVIAIVILSSLQMPALSLSILPALSVRQQVATCCTVSQRAQDSYHTDTRITITSNSYRQRFTYCRNRDSVCILYTCIRSVSTTHLINANKD